MAGYLHNVGGRQGRVLADIDYQALARATDVTSRNPGQQLRRHHLLAMDSPLNLIRRINGRSWATIELTNLGDELATASDSSSVLERALHDIVFCREPWYPSTRVRQYSDFDVHPYVMALRVMEDCEGWIDRDEYDLFLSRTRSEDEVAWAVAAIEEFRSLDSQAREALLKEVEIRVPGEKAYQNWRDMALHTFSLFSLGISVVRVEQNLLLTDRLIEPRASSRRRTRPAGRRTIELRIPQPPVNPEVAVPPSAPSVNPGTDGEVLVGKLLTAAGYQVVFYSNRRGFGFDIWAGHGETAMLIEVKSSQGTMGAVNLTRLEYEAAKQHGPSYVLAVVENITEAAPIIRFIQDPVSNLHVEARTATEYYIPRAAWASAPAFEPGA